MKEKKVPMRRCVGCGESKPKQQLVRIACYEGKIAVDPTGRAKGRGIYLCRDAQCLKKAVKKKAVIRAFGTDIPEAEMEILAKEIETDE